MVFHLNYAMTCTSKIIRLLQTLLLVMPLHLSAQMYTAKGIRTTLYSAAPLEDIRAVSVNGIAAFNSKNRELAVQIPVRSFEFDKKLMQEHFNENYMDSDKYPLVRFRGIVDPTIDFSKDGTHTVMLEGILTVHGIDKKRTLPARLSIREGNIQISTQFIVNCTDHGIKIPTLMFKKIAASVSITAEGQLQPLNK